MEWINKADLDAWIAERPLCNVRKQLRNKMENEWDQFWKKEHGRDYETIGE